MYKKYIRGGYISHKSSILVILKRPVTRRQYRAVLDPRPALRSEYPGQNQPEEEVQPIHGNENHAVPSLQNPLNLGYRT